ncbi:carboxymuconolactone decarboxylase family protein [Nocardia sp. NPDC051981]|uniref:carboxymuconolactone decarboxylase family protein n=1 Tax=Nocardia sp. NPDC051981 TaxID=3155417 RepID=UPI00342D0F90
MTRRGKRYRFSAAGSAEVGEEGAGRIPPATRERLALLVAQHNRSDYELSAHAYRGAKVTGLPEEETIRARQAASADPEAEAALAFNVHPCAPR